jgi:hypothetical protein
MIDRQKKTNLKIMIVGKRKKKSFTKNIHLNITVKVYS